MVRGAWLVAVVVAGCGRHGFDALTDAALDDAPEPDAPLPLCVRYAGALHCDDFEAASTGGGTRVEAAGIDGSYGLQFVAPPGVQPRRRFTLPTLVTSGVIHVAARINIAAGASTQSYVVLAQTLAADFVDKISFDLNMLDRAQLANTIAGGGAQQAADGSMPRGTWACFELIVNAADAGGGGLVELRLDGALVLSGWQDLPTVPAVGFEHIEIGAFSDAANTEAVTVTFDNWIVDTQPIGCP